MPSGKKKRKSAKKVREDGCQARENLDRLRVETGKDVRFGAPEERDVEISTPKTPVQGGESDEVDTASQIAESVKLSSSEYDSPPSQAFELKTEFGAAAEENDSLLLASSSGFLADWQTASHLPCSSEGHDTPEAREEVALLDPEGKAGDVNLQFGDSEPCFMQANLERSEVPERELGKSVPEAVGDTDRGNKDKENYRQPDAVSGADDKEPVTAKPNTSSNTDGQTSELLLEGVSLSLEHEQSRQLSKDIIVDWKTISQLADVKSHGHILEAREEGRPEGKGEDVSLQVGDSKEPHLWQVNREGFEASELVLDESVPDAVGIIDGEEPADNTQAHDRQLCAASGSYDNEPVEVDLNTASNTCDKTSEPLLEDASFSLELRQSSQFSMDTNVASEEEHPTDGAEPPGISTPEEAQPHTSSSSGEQVLAFSTLGQVHGDTVLILSRQIDDTVVAAADSGGDSGTINFVDTNCHGVSDTTGHKTDHFSPCNVLENRASEHTATGKLEAGGLQQEDHTESKLPDVLPFEASDEAGGDDDILCPEDSLGLSAAKVDARETAFLGQSTLGTGSSVFGGIVNAVQETTDAVLEVSTQEEATGNALVSEFRNGGSAVLQDPTFMTGISESESIKVDREGAFADRVETGDERVVDAELSQENINKTFSECYLIGHVTKNAEVNVEEPPGFVLQELKNEQADKKSEATVQKNAMQNASDIAGEEGKLTSEVEDLGVVKSDKVVESTQVVDTQKEAPNHCRLFAKKEETDGVRERYIEQQATVTSWKGCCGVLDCLLGW